MSNNLKSFSNARKAFQANLSALLAQFNYTATSFSMRLNQSAFSSGSTKHVTTAEDVDSWITGTKIPSLYAIYKVTGFFNVTIDALLSSEPIPTTTVTGKSFAKHTAASPKVNPITTPAVTTTATTPKGTNMTAKKSTSNTKKMKELIEARTSSTSYNMPLAYKVITSDMQVKDIAAQVGVTPRSIRDYMYDSSSMTPEVAKALAATLKTNTNSLGLKLNKEINRYEAVSVR